MSSIRTKTLAATGVGMGFAALIAVAGLAGLRSVRSQFDELADRATPAHVLLLNIDRDSYQAQLALEQALTANDAEARSAAETDFRENAAQTGERFDAYQAVALQVEGETARWAAYVDARSAWVDAGEALLAATELGGEVEPSELARQGEAFESARTMVDSLAGDFYEGFIEGSNEDMRATTSAQQAVLLAALLATLASGALVLRMVTRGLGPLKDLAEAAERMATGETALDGPPMTRNDEVGRLSRAFEALAQYMVHLATTLQAASVGDLTARPAVHGTRDALGTSTTALLGSLSNVVGAMRDAIDRLAGSSDQLLALSDTLGDSADRTSSQATGAAEAGQQMHQAIREVSRNASEAVEVAGRAVGLATRSQAIVARLERSSSEVGSVLGVINELAAQTNLLALNATIEAARAGEAGRGFAVVADEVKHLATQTTEATEGVRQRVDAIQSDTAHAITSIGEVGSIIAAIAERMESIAAAVEEQEVTTTEIAERISGVSSLAESNRRATQDTTTAATDLNDLAKQLDQIVSGFVVQNAA